MKQSPTTEFKINESRVAVDNIRGYVYQIYQSVLAWIELEDNEKLVLEGAEDFDIFRESQSVTTTQVKDLKANLSLRSPSIVDSINNFWISQKQNIDFKIKFRFLTTANSTTEKGSPFGKNINGIEYWNRITSHTKEFDNLKQFLLSLNLSIDLKTFIKTATHEELYKNLIARIKWDMGEKSIAAIKSLILDKLKVHGSKFGVDTISASKVLPHVLMRVADLVSTKGLRELTKVNFLDQFDGVTRVSIPQNVLANFNTILTSQIANKVEKSKNLPSIYITPFPLIEGGIHRKKLVSNLKEKLNKEKILFIYGSSGKGKTILAY